MIQLLRRRLGLPWLLILGPSNYFLLRGRFFLGLGLGGLLLLSGYLPLRRRLLLGRLLYKCNTVKSKNSDMSDAESHACAHTAAQT